MSLIQKYLQLPLKIQIHVGITLLSTFSYFFMFTLYLSFLAVYQNKYYNLKKQYFDDLNQKIIKDYLIFQNLCLHQFEQLIKLFNYKTYTYLDSVDLYLQLIKDEAFPIDKSLVEIYEPGKYYESMIYKGKSVFFFCYDESDEVCDFIYEKVEFNSRLALLQETVMNNFRVSFYGDFQILDEYVYLLLRYKALFSSNITRIWHFLNETETINKTQNIDEKLKNHYEQYKKFFIDYANNKLHFINIMFITKYKLFSDYAELVKNNTNEQYISEYLKNQSKHFHYLNFSQDTSIVYDGSDYKDSYYICKNTIAVGFIDFLFAKLSRFFNVVSIPIDYNTKKLISKNLCLFFMIKQYIQIKKEMSSDDLKKIQSFINEQKGDLNIEQCKLEKYIMKDETNNKLESSEINKFFDLEYQLKSVMYTAFKNQANSEYLSYKFSFPDFNSLYYFKPNYLIFDQLNIYSFVSNINMIHIEEEIRSFYKKTRLFCVLCLIYIGIISAFTIGIIASKVEEAITKPINKLQLSIESKMNPLIKKENEQNIFEFKYDDTINDFFGICKKFIEGDIKSDNELFSNDILNDNNNKNINSNLITDHKLIAYLKKSFEKENLQEKNIYMFDKYYFIRKDKRKKSKTRLISNGSSEMNEKNKNKIEENNIDTYKDLFLFSELITGEKEKNQNLKVKKTNKTLITQDHGSKIDQNIKNKKTVITNKYITYHWYKEAKETFANAILNYYDNKEYNNFLCK